MLPLYLEHLTSPLIRCVCLTGLLHSGHQEPSPPFSLGAISDLSPALLSQPSLKQKSPSDTV